MRSLRTMLLTAIVTSTAALAGPPTTRPVPPTTPLGPIDRPEVIDPRLPAFAPKFAENNRPPAGQFDERSYYYRYGGATPVQTGGYGFFRGGFGFGRGNWGSTTTINN